MSVKELVKEQNTTLEFYLKSKDFRLSSKSRPTEVQKLSPIIRDKLFPSNLF